MKTFLVPLLFACVLFFHSCNDDDGAIPEPPRMKRIIVRFGDIPTTAKSTTFFIDVAFEVDSRRIARLVPADCVQVTI